MVSEYRDMLILLMEQYSTTVENRKAKDRLKSNLNFWSLAKCIYQI